MFNNNISPNESRAWQLSLSESKLHNNSSLTVWVGLRLNKNLSDEVDSLGGFNDVSGLSSEPR